MEVRGEERGRGEGRGAIGWQVSFVLLSGLSSAASQLQMVYHQGRDIQMSADEICVRRREKC